MRATMKDRGSADSVPIRRSFAGPVNYKLAAALTAVRSDWRVDVHDRRGRDALVAVAARLLRGVTTRRRPRRPRTEGTDQMKATELLKKQHREVKGLFREVKKASDARGRRSGMDEIAAKLEAHMRIEETIFYP